MNKKIGIVEDHVHKENGAAWNEENPGESDSQACESKDSTNLNQPFAEEAVTIDHRTNPKRKKKRRVKWI
ncbi:conserved hypothetical protein [Ricinus communis]|uniref:Uncharacterized protein n=1 Tax=Ricinus communis TaxID=3988 RepID=B9SA01_RICCO|nr:conserved hypothetical protein [Ricinus communis]